MVPITYFEAVVVFEIEIDTKAGVKIKKIKERYLIDAGSVTAAEARVHEFLKDSSATFTVDAVKSSKIVNVLN